MRNVLARLQARVVYIADEEPAGGDGGSTSDASARFGRLAEAIAPPSVRIGRRSCQRDLVACQRKVAVALGLSTVAAAPRAALPNDAL